MLQDPTSHNIFRQLLANAAQVFPPLSGTEQRTSLYLDHELGVEKFSVSKRPYLVRFLISLDYDAIYKLKR